MKTYKLDKDLHGPLMVENAAGGWVSRIDAADLQRQLVALTQDRNEWRALAKVRDQLRKMEIVDRQSKDAPEC